MSTGPFAFFPMIFGHEAVGVVESVGEHVEEFQEGDMVVPVFVRIAENVETASPKREMVAPYLVGNWSLQCRGIKQVGSRG
ncbi:hypothetical protein ES332_D06G042600v1 [Gossypium tomentosum]|uniref:Alcohol dehydrogenase-like N-terminal domain-containing protein n=1 Tax=Gossypium tomentosum TaxID=34277 RepID=A0A5D2KEI0_GOSTO|nr:hypothetical protein ES332_D06G042600v1 [Gossypium tomentosum]